LIDYWWRLARWLEENKDENLEEMETEETNDEIQSESETPLKAKGDKLKKEDSGRKKKKIEHDDE
jgi:hypothetical protein